MKLFKEFAFDPIGIIDQKSGRVVFSALGMSSGCMISSFQNPKSWAKVVNLELERRKSDKTIDFSTYSKLKLAIEPLGKSVSAREEKFLPNHTARRPYDGNLSWIENAASANAIASFAGILSDGSSPSIAIDDYDFSNPNTSCPPHVIVPRDEISLIDAIRVLLELSKQAVFVDPHFDGKAKRFQALPCKIIADFPNIQDVKIITQDGSQKSTPSKSTEPSDFAKWASGKSPLLPKGKKLKVFIIKDKPDSEQLHARYILTEAGGVMIDPGIDTGSAPGDNFKITRLDPASYRAAWEWYVNFDGFEVTDSFNITS